MPRLIKNKAIVEDAWTLVRENAAIEAVLVDGQWIVPLAFFHQHRAEIKSHQQRIGVWLAPADDPATLAADVAVLPLIAIDFPKFTDGRGYSSARLLREQYGFTGELRAIGDVLHDQLFYLARCGFDSFALRSDRDMNDALRAFQDFSEPYQASVDQPVPFFRRRLAGRVSEADGTRSKAVDAS